MMPYSVSRLDISAIQVGGGQVIGGRAKGGACLIEQPDGATLDIADLGCTLDQDLEDVGGIKGGCQ
jgi:hypothetical protein